MRVAKVVITLGAVLLIVGGFFTYAYLNPSGHDPTRTVILDVSPGRNYHQVARELESAGVLTDARKFLVLVKLMGQSQKLRVGEYELEHRQPPLQVLEKITSGKSLQRRFTIPEGYNIYEVAEQIAFQCFHVFTHQFRGPVTLL